MAKIRNYRQTIDRETAEVYAILATITAKLYLTFVLSLSWVAMLITLILRPSVYLAVTTSVLPLTLTIVIKHYFPTVPKSSPLYSYSQQRRNGASKTAR